MILHHADELPDTIFFNNVAYKLRWRKAPWGYEVADIFGVVVVLRFGDRCQMVFNTCRDLYAPPVKIRVAGMEPHPLWSQTGFLFLGPGVPKADTLPPATDFIAKEMLNRIISGNYNIPLTYIGGSKNVDNGYHPFFRHADKVGWSDLHTRWAYGFLAYEIQRPRNHIEPGVGAPYGLVSLDSAIPPIPGIHERYESPAGLNPADAMHLDGTELYETWRRLKHPEFVHAHAVMWAWARRFCPLLLRKDKVYSGVPRVPAYAIRESNRLCVMMDEIGGGKFTDEVNDDFYYHADKAYTLINDGRDGKPWYTTDNIKDNVPHQKPWMFGPLADEVRDIDPGLSNILLDRLEEHWYDETMGLAYRELYKGDDRIVDAWCQVPGVGDWWMKALIDGGRQDSPPAKYLREQLDDYKNTLHGVSRLAPLIGW